MPRTRDYRLYPEAFGEVLKAGALAPTRIPFENEVEAKRFMSRMYAYNTSLKVAKLKPPEGYDMVELMALHAAVLKVQYRVEGSVFLARPQDQDPDVAIIRAALGGLRSEVPSGPSAAFFEEVKDE